MIRFVLRSIQRGARPVVGGRPFPSGASRIYNLNELPPVLDQIEAHMKAGRLEMFEMSGVGKKADISSIRARLGLLPDAPAVAVALVEAVPVEAPVAVTPAVLELTRTETVSAPLVAEVFVAAPLVEETVEAPVEAPAPELPPVLAPLTAADLEGLKLGELRTLLAERGGSATGKTRAAIVAELLGEEA